MRAFSSSGVADFLSMVSKTSEVGLQEAVKGAGRQRQLWEDGELRTHSGEYALKRASSVSGVAAEAPSPLGGPSVLSAIPEPAVVMSLLPREVKARSISTGASDTMRFALQKTERPSQRKRCV